MDVIAVIYPEKNGCTMPAGRKSLTVEINRNMKQRHDLADALITLFIYERFHPWFCGFGALNLQSLDRKEDFSDPA